MERNGGNIISQVAVECCWQCRNDLPQLNFSFLSHLSVHEHSSSSRVFLMSSLQSEQMLIDDVFWHNGSKIFID